MQFNSKFIYRRSLAKYDAVPGRLNQVNEKKEDTEVGETGTGMETLNKEITEILKVHFNSQLTTTLPKLWARKRGN